MDLRLARFSATDEIGTMEARHVAAFEHLAPSTVEPGQARFDAPDRRGRRHREIAFGRPVRGGDRVPQLFPSTGGSRWLALVVLCAGILMIILDGTIVNVALNTIGGNLGASIDEVAWVTTGYILASVVVMPLNGWLTAYLGRKRFYATSLAIFTIASLLCGTARSIWVLVFYRVLQGIGGGALLLVYALYRRDPVFIAGQALGLLVYIRNLYFIMLTGRQSSAAN